MKLNEKMPRSPTLPGARRRAHHRATASRVTPPRPRRRRSRARRAAAGSSARSAGCPSMWTGTIAFGIGAPAFARRSISVATTSGSRFHGPQLAVDQHDPGAAVADHVHRRDEREVRHPDLVARPDAGGDQREVECCGPGDGGDGVVRPDGLGQCGLEGRQVGPEHEVAVPDGPRRGLGLVFSHRRLGEPDPRPPSPPLSRPPATAPGRSAPPLPDSVSPVRAPVRTSDTKSQRWCARSRESSGGRTGYCRRRPAWNTGPTYRFRGRQPRGVATRLSPPAMNSEPLPEGGSTMLRLQAPLPDRYTTGDARRAQRLDRAPRRRSSATGC